MSRTRLWVACCALSILSGCLSERPRPAPPALVIILTKKTVRSPDTLNGTLRAQDAEGIDSVWLTVDAGPRVGQDGLLATEFESPFQVQIRVGHLAGDRVPVKMTARDVAGFVAELDTAVTVVP